jgi:hypothetical protein
VRRHRRRQRHQRSHRPAHLVDRADPGQGCRGWSRAGR